MARTSRKKPEEVIFHSKYGNLKLTMKPPTREGVGIHSRIVPGRLIQFEDGIYKTSDPEEIQFIRKHRWFGKFIWEQSQISQQDIMAGLGMKVRIPCGYVDEDGEECDFVAEGTSGPEAMKSLRGHWSAMGHWPKDDNEEEEEEEEEEDEETDSEDEDEEE